MQQQFRLAQKAIVLNDDHTKILVSKYLSSKYLAEKLAGKLCLPGGQMEFGETPDYSLIKEVKEETGVNIIPGQPIYIWTWTYQKEQTQKQIVAVARVCQYKSGEIKVPETESETTLDIARWLDLKDITIGNFVFDEQPALLKMLEDLKR